MSLFRKTQDEGKGPGRQGDQAAPEPGVGEEPPPAPAPAEAQTAFPRNVNVAGGEKASVRRISIGLNKSVIVRLPRPTRS